MSDTSSRPLGEILGGAVPGWDSLGGPVRTPEEWAVFDEEQRRAAQAEVLADRTARRLENLLEGRPVPYAERHPLPADAAAWARRVVDDPWQGVLWFGGTTGSGKTTAAWATLELAVASGYGGRVLVVNWEDLWEALAPPVDMEARHRAGDADLLMLDNLSDTTAWDRKHLHWVLNRRWEQRQPTIITSKAALADLLNEDTASRCADKITKVPMGNVDHRRQS
jgi:hypothetical protein